MEIKKIGNRGTLFTFYDLGIPTNVYVIHGTRYIYVVDTYLGPDSMQSIIEYIDKEYNKKELIIINSHNHWDHVWGNCLFSANIIIAHKLCKEYMEQDGQESMEVEKEFLRGKVTLNYPNLLITDKLIFEEDGVLIYYTPGHTDDGVSVIDLEDKVLFAGDNLERPLPYIMSTNLEQYVKTLEEYLLLGVDVVIGGHTICEDKQLVRDNLKYIKCVANGDTTEYDQNPYREYHNCNIQWLNSNNK